MDRAAIARIATLTATVGATICAGTAGPAQALPSYQAGTVAQPTGHTTPGTPAGGGSWTAGVQNISGDTTTAAPATSHPATSRPAPALAVPKPHSNPPTAALPPLATTGSTHRARKPPQPLPAGPTSAPATTQPSPPSATLPQVTVTVVVPTLPATTPGPTITPSSSTPAAAAPPRTPADQPTIAVPEPASPQQGAVPPATSTPPAGTGPTTPGGPPSSASPSSGLTNPPDASLPSTWSLGIQSTSSPSPAAPTDSSAPQPSSTQPSSASQPSSGSSVGFHGWSSGASGDNVTTTFGTWRGSPVGIVGTWADPSSASDQANPASLAHYAAFDGDLDISVGGTVLGSGESYAQAAAGAYTDRWTQLAQNLQAARGDKPGIIYVRPFEEFNGDWYPGWQVTPANVADYQKAFQLFAQTIRANCTACKIVWNPNNGTSAGSASPLDAYPGDASVDVIGVDSYNANGATVVTDSASWTQYADATTNGIPVGPEAWRQFAAAHGKPIAFPEWGLDHSAGGGDDPAYIQGFHDWMAAHAAQPGDPDVAGKVVYDIYFNIDQDHTGFMITGGDNPQSSATYRSLSWGTTTPPGGSSPGGGTPGGGTPGAQAVAGTTPATDPTANPAPTTGPVAGAGPNPTTTPTVPGPAGVTAPAQAYTNIPYATASTAQRLDLYLPARTGAAVPLVIDLHGGAFTSGDKTDPEITSNVQALLAQGYAVASINYRLAAEAPFPAPVQDAKAAVRWLRAHAAGYGIDPARFAAWGQSAGGYLATMLAVTGGQPNTTLDDATLGNAGVSSAVQAAVSLSGFVSPTTIDAQLQSAGCATADLGSADATDAAFLGTPGQPPATSTNLHAADVTAWIPSAPPGSLPPMYLADGTADCTVPAAQPQQLQTALQNAGDTAVTLDLVQGAGHADPTIDQGRQSAAIALLAQALATPTPATTAPALSPTPSPVTTPGPVTPASTTAAPATPAPTSTSTTAAATAPPAVTSTGS